MVFLAVGFETTVLTIAATLQEAEDCGIDNFTILSGSKIIEPPLCAPVQDGDVQMAIAALLEQILAGRPAIENHYRRVSRGSLVSDCDGDRPLDMLSGAELPRIC